MEMTIATIGRLMKNLDIATYPLLAGLAGAAAGAARLVESNAEDWT